MDLLQEVINSTKAYYCLECGKCTAACPVARRDTSFSPRLTVEMALLGRSQELLEGKLGWSCLTCRLCSERCPSDVRYSEFVRGVRTLVGHREHAVPCAHGSVMQTLMGIMTRPDLRQERLSWLSSDLQTAVDSGVLYFVGCLPYYEVLFCDLNVESVEIARSAVRVLNALGVSPAVLAVERCCGHDLLWSGDVDGFRRLAMQNVALLNASGAHTIITTCPECYRTLAVDYAGCAGGLKARVLHLSQYVMERIGDREQQAARGKQQATGEREQQAARDKQQATGDQEADTGQIFHPLLQKQKVTYHDPCRLGRYMGVYEAPRCLLKALGYEVLEMAHSGPAALCCGTSAWLNCNAVSKQIQLDRLQEAVETGADLLVTACAKCQIHFKCAQKDADTPQHLRIEVHDLATLLARHL